MILAAGLSLILSFCIGDIFVNLAKGKAKAELLLSVNEIRLTLMQSVVRTDQWATTVAHNSAMACFSGAVPSSCLAMSGKPAQGFKLYGPGGALLYDGLSLTSGYTNKGASCDGFGLSSDCLLKPLLTWRLQCNLPADPQCLAPLVLVDLDYLYLGSNASGVNFSNYGFHLAISPFQIKAGESCTGVVPSCAASQAAVCESGFWICREFGL